MLQRRSWINSVASFSQPAPFGIVRNWLGSQTVDWLLRYAQSNKALFEESDVYGRTQKVDNTLRRSVMLRKIDNLRSEIELEAKIRNLLPVMFERLGNTPFIPRKFEIEMVAHGDGAFFSRHIDTRTKTEGPVSHRIISAVYYFYALPKAFTGGVLRLHSLEASGQQGTFIDIEPDYDTLVFFPSWFPHEVLPVHVPSNQFLDSRFAINCWIHRGS
jgi:SM-20-related protein